MLKHIKIALWNLMAGLSALFPRVLRKTSQMPSRANMAFMVPSKLLQEPSLGADER